jgi:hypothetical protein
MFRHFLMIISAIVVTMAMSLVAVSSGEASSSDHDYDPREECSDKNWERYEANCDGWHVTIVNDNSEGISLDRDEITGVSRARDWINSDETTAEARGKESWLGGPQNMFLSYGAYKLLPWKSDLAGDWYRYIHIKSTLSGGTMIKCGVWKADRALTWPIYPPGIGCDVLKEAADQPIVIRFHVLEDGPWKTSNSTFFA